MIDLSVDASETLRNEVQSGEVEVESQGVSKSVPAGYALLARAGEPPSDPVPQLPAPEVTVDSQAGSVSASWPPVQGAQAYRLELYQLPDEVLVGQFRTEPPAWQSPLPVGEYRLLVRAEDDQGLRGKEQPVALMVSDVMPEPQPEEEKRSWLDLMLFLGGAAIMLSL